ncbi:MAG: hypothetical protein WCG19_10070 [Chlorobiaceae bacterium]
MMMMAMAMGMMVMMGMGVMMMSGASQCIIIDTAEKNTHDTGNSGKL